jgi:hypothetical protein
LLLLLLLLLVVGCVTTLGLLRNRLFQLSKPKLMAA